MKISSQTLSFIVAGAMLLATVPAVTAATNYVAYGNYYFSPSDLTIRAGDTVIWTNAGGLHTVTGLSTGEPLCGNSSVNTCTNTFSTPGVFLYQCDFHYSLGMTGVVRVLSLSGTPAVLTNAIWTNGNFVFRVLSTANQTNIVQAATGLTGASNWVSLDTNVEAGSNFVFTDTNASRFPTRFYRVVQP